MKSFDAKTMRVRIHHPDGTVTELEPMSSLDYAKSGGDRHGGARAKKTRAAGLEPVSPETNTSRKSGENGSR